MQASGKRGPLNQKTKQQMKKVRKNEEAGITMAVAKQAQFQRVIVLEEEVV